ADKTHNHEQDAEPDVCRSQPGNARPIQFFGKFRCFDRAAFEKNLGGGNAQDTESELEPRIEQVFLQNLDHSRRCKWRRRVGSERTGSKAGAKVLTRGLRTGWSSSLRCNFGS